MIVLLYPVRSQLLPYYLQFYLSCVAEHCSPANQSAASELLRPVSSGVQTFSTDTSETPAGQPLNKLAATLQVAYSKLLNVAIVRKFITIDFTDFWGG